MTEPTHDWEAAYQQDDRAPWDIERPQPAFAALADAGLLTGDVLDAGCGTGEHALLLASRGERVTGIDVSETAIAAARRKAVDRKLEVSFEVGDILTMSLPRDGFDAVIDSGLFHVFSDHDRARYVAALAGTLRSGGVCWLMCFSELQPGDWGPRRVTQDEIRAAFSDGWLVERLEPAMFDVNRIFGVTTVQAWLSTIRRA